MAVQPLEPIMMGDATLTFGTDNYEAHVSSVVFTPSSSVVNWKGLTPTAVYSFGVNPTWTLDLELAQDHENAASLSNYLFDHQGESIEVVFAPKSAGRTYTATVIITAGAIGGAVDAVATSTVSLGVQGQPVPSVIVP